MYKITFEILNENFNKYDLLFKWCSNDFVYEWFEQRKLSLNEIKEKYYKKIKNGLQKCFIIKFNEIPIGYFQYYKSDYKKDDGIYEYDVFIGNKDYLGKGFGKIIVEEINNYIFKNEMCNKIILRPFTRNVRAIKTYEKCGFIIIDEYLDKDTIGNNENITVMEISK